MGMLLCDLFGCAMLVVHESIYMAPMRSYVERCQELPSRANDCHLRIGFTTPDLP